MKLFIAEKPSLGITVARSLGAWKKHKGYITGDGVIVTWCFGHLYELFEPSEYDIKFKQWTPEDLPIIPLEFRLKEKSDASEQIAIINSLINNLGQTDVVINCGDPDREGQLLVDEVIEQSGFDGFVMRAWLKDLTDKGVRKTLDNLKNNREFESLSVAAKMRSRSDWITGINLTRAYTCQAQKHGHQGVITIGRVQTPTLNLVVQRDKSIDDFKQQQFFEHEIKVGTEGDTFVASEVCEKRFDKQEALIDLPEPYAEVTSYKKSTKTKYAKLPFTLSDLQASCNKKYGYTAKNTLAIAQRLYEVHKLTSYPRTDCPYLNEADFFEKRELIDQVIQEFHVENKSTEQRPKCFDDKKVGAHTGIIPLSVYKEGLSDDEQNVFDLIKERFVCQFLKPMKYNEVVVELKSGKLDFKSTGKQIIEAGFLKAIDNKTSPKDEMLPTLKVGEKLKVISSQLLTKQTASPKRFTEGTLIKAMANVASLFDKGENKSLLKEIGGIGTEATRASILENLKERGFLELEKKVIKSTPKAKKLMTLLAEDIKSPILTAQWENLLKKIENKELDKTDYLNRLEKWIYKNCNDATTIDMSILGGVRCPCCHDGYIVTKRGKYSSFEGCNQYPICTYIVPQKRKNKRKKRRAS